MVSLIINYKILNFMLTDENVTVNLIELELIGHHYIILRIKEILQNLRKEKLDGD